MNSILPGPYEPLGDGFVTFDDVAAIVRSDVPTMTEADLAAILCAIMREGDLPVTRIVETIVRDELARRRAMFPASVPLSVL